MSDEERARNMIAAHWGFDRAHMRTAIMEALSAARAEEREACARLASPTMDEITLRAGEMSAQERRTVLAVLGWIAAAIRGRK